MPDVYMYSMVFSMMDDDYSTRMDLDGVIQQCDSYFQTNGMLEISNTKHLLSIG